ncbi:MAG: hypothetical protein ACRDMJ_06795 [Solirubrobacteraceae bacterium]
MTDAGSSTTSRTVHDDPVQALLVALSPAQIARFQRTLKALALSRRVNVVATLAGPRLIEAEKKVAAELALRATDPAQQAFPTPSILP